MYTFSFIVCNIIPKVYTFSFIVGNIIPKSVKCIHSATKNLLGLILRDFHIIDDLEAPMADQGLQLGSWDFWEQGFRALGSELCGFRFRCSEFRV